MSKKPADVGNYFERGAWHEAFEALRLADQKTLLTADDLERLGFAAYFIGRESEFELYFERLHRVHLEEGNPRPAARAAFWLGLTLMFRGELAQSNAWISRGQRLVENLACAEQGYLLLPGAELTLRSGDAVTARLRAADAAAIGEHFGDADLVATARHVEGRALLAQGQILAGLALLDETMLPVIAGELTPMTTGLMYCSVLEACSKVCALGRAREWTAAFSRWCDRQSESLVFSTTCLVHRAEIQQSRGDWSAALEDVCRACERAEGMNRKPPGAALYQRGEVHRLRGELPQAEEAYRMANELGYDPQPGLALLRVTQGRIEAASATMRRTMHTTTLPTKRARLLPGHIEVMLAADDIDGAREACRELNDLSETLDADSLRAAAAAARGAIEIAETNPAAAINELRRAQEFWTRLDFPYEVARVRILIGIACRALDDEETAQLEFAVARAVLEQLCARHDVARIDSVSAAATSGTRARLSPRELQVLRLIAAGSTNKAIATQLSLSERTVDRHVSNILVKLAVPSRAAAIAFAYEHALL